MLSRPRLHRLRLRTGVTISPPLRGFGRWAPDGGCVGLLSVRGRGLCWRGGAASLPPGLPRMWRSGGPIPGLRGSLVGMDAIAPPPPSAAAPNRGYHAPPLRGSGRWAPDGGCVEFLSVAGWREEAWGRAGGEERRVDGSRGAGGGLLSPVRSGAGSGQPRQRMAGTRRAETGGRGARIPARPSPGGCGPGRFASAQEVRLFQIFRMI